MVFWVDEGDVGGVRSEGREVPGGAKEPRGGGGRRGTQHVGSLPGGASGGGGHQPWLFWGLGLHVEEADSSASEVTVIQPKSNLDERRGDAFEQKLRASCRIPCLNIPFREVLTVFQSSDMFFLWIII